MNPLARIIDANFNRAREALRVMEDAARFALDDADLSATLKTLRHDLLAAIDSLASHGLDRGHLLASRDTPGDVGTTISTPSESVRRGLPAIAAAAAARLTEALRSLEEAAKALSASAGHDFEQLRYRAYDVERRLGLALGAGRAPQWRLCILITEQLCSRPWEDVARAAIAGGADCLQLREKELEGRELLARARRLVAIAREPNHPGPRPAIIINDRPDIAILARADGVHLGQHDLPIADARTIVGHGLLIGCSTTNLDQARAAAQAGADYCGLGPMFHTTTKHKPTLAGPEFLAAYLADALCRTRPHLAIGGISPDNISALHQAGCRGIAVSSAVCSAPDPEAVCRDLLAGSLAT